MTLPLEILPLGGLGEIGMNCMLVGHRDRWIVIDCGVQFPDPWDLGAERKLVDLEMLADFADRIEAVVVTHGHEDHIGGLPWLLPLLDDAVPLVATRFTGHLIERRLSEHQLWRDDRMVSYAAGERFEAGPFEIEAIRVTHSLPDCCSLAMRCEDGTLLHTGDWKIDEHPMDGEAFDRAAFERLGDEGVTVMLSDSTNVLVPGRTESERTVARALLERIEAHPGRVIVTQFASNLHRLTALVEAAEATDRRLCFAGRSLHTYLRAAARDGRAPIDPGHVVDMEHLDSLPDHKVLLVTTGSQGEMNAALKRAAEGRHRYVQVRKGDLVLHSARVIPGNEATVYNMLNSLSMTGADIVYGRRTGIHASGHARQDELTELMDLVRPQHFIPIHGEYTFLRHHAALAQARGLETTVAVNGEHLAVGAGTGGGPARVERVDYEAPTIFYNDGPATGDKEAMLLHERKRLAWNGVVVVDVELQELPGGGATGTAHVRTFALFTDGGRLPDDLRAAAERSVRACPPGTPAREMEEAVRLSVRQAAKRAVDKKPEVVVVLHRGRLGGAS